MFPLFLPEWAGYRPSVAGTQALGAFRMAVREINNKTDGVRDALLPATRLKYVFRDPKVDTGVAVLSAIDLLQRTNCDAAYARACGRAVCRGVAALVGPGVSSTSADVQQLAKQFGVPQIGFAATSPALSRKDLHPYFLRLVPSDTMQAVAQARLIRELGWRCVSTIAGTDEYSAAGRRALLEALRHTPVRVAAAVSLAANQQRAAEEVRHLQTAGCSLVVVWLPRKDLATFLRAAHARGLYGGGKVQWLLSETILQPLQAIAPGPLAQTLAGALATAPYNGIGSPRHHAALRRWRRQRSTARPAGQCADDTDDDPAAPTPVNRQDHDDDPATPDACAGVDFASDALDLYGPYAYDAAFAIAQALHALIEGRGLQPCDPPLYHRLTAATVAGPDGPCFTGKALLQELLGTSLGGVSGDVRFDANGDRSLDGMRYMLYNHRGQVPPTRPHRVPCTEDGIVDK